MNGAKIKERKKYKLMSGKQTDKLEKAATSSSKPRAGQKAQKASFSTKNSQKEIERKREREIRIKTK